MFCGGGCLNNDCAVIGDAREKFEDGPIVSPDKKSVIPIVHQLALGDAFDFREIENHRLLSVTVQGYYAARQRHLERVAVTVQMTAPALVTWNTMTGVELEPAGNTHSALACQPSL